MIFNYSVAPTRVIPQDSIGILFIPDNIEIHVGAKEVITNEDETTTEVVPVQTILSQQITGGYIEERRSQKLPASVLSAISGFDVNTMKPTINTQALSQILSQFDLKLT